jgi:gamma-glutamyltranspeptidase
VAVAQLASINTLMGSIITQTSAPVASIGAPGGGQIQETVICIYRNPFIAYQ